MPHRSTRPLVIAAAAVILATAGMAGPATAHGPSGLHVRVVARGLDNPRGIAVGKDGRVYVALAGKGGTGPNGYGTSGKIVQISWGHARTVLGGLPSMIDDEGEVTGPVNVGLNGYGNAFAVIGGGPQDVNKRFGTVLRLHPRPARVYANIAAYQKTDPDPTDLDIPSNPYDSNPYGIATLGDGRLLVTDAGGNDLLLIKGNRRIATVVRFPNEVVSTASLPPVPPYNALPAAIPAEAVPTTVAVGPDGYWYVGELKGFPFTPGTSRIWRVAPWARNVTCDPTATSGPCTLFMDGFTSITGLAFGHDGSLYVVEMVKSGVFNFFSGTDTVGALWKVKHGHKTELVPGRLTLPGDVAVARDGAIYVTNKSVSVGGGQVLKISH
jgi:hypothetical protein